MKILCLPDGSILVKNVDVFKDDNKLRDSGTVALCRCGQSAKKPFCDGSHVKAKFRAESIELTLEFPEKSESNER